MPVKGGTKQACAACKYQRRKCSRGCLLAPYFPANKPKMFQNVHRLYGVCNVVKILRQLREEDREEAMRSIIFESNMRRKYPVYGCSFVLELLKIQIMQVLEELYWVNPWLAMVRSKEYGYSHVISDLARPFQKGLGFASKGTNNNSNQPNIDQTCFDSCQFFECDKDIGYDVNSFLLQLQPPKANDSCHVNNLSRTKIDITSHEMITYMLQQVLMPETEVSYGYYDMPLYTIAKDRQSFKFESKNAL